MKKLRLITPLPLLKGNESVKDWEEKRLWMVSSLLNDLYLTREL